MLISTRGRYALRVMLDLAEHNTGAYIVLPDIAARQEVSEKYLESIITALVKNKLVETQRGRRGGYRLSKSPEEYPIREILQLTEKTLSPVGCLREGSKPCARAKKCLTLPLWKQLDALIQNYLDSVTLADLLTGNLPDAVPKA